ncbi:MAG TPA: prolyl oligopeptidase family serine peptidase, partial [Rubrivivax sp.]|nr:prolyl oligopeptidase family serine peptidase [Rubrivivax sp.]
LALTSLGFAVFVLDGRGTPMRGKAFHDSSWGPGHADACGLADHAAAVAQLVLQLPDLDAGRVGIYGASGGGYAAARAVLQYPDVFHAAFAAAGNHDQRLYCARYERYLGLLPESAAHYDAADNTALAGELRRPLLLAHGLLDDDVHPIATLRLAAALQRAGKPVELLVVPQGGHAIDQLDDVLIRKWQFFCEHLRPVISECGKMSS